MKKAVLMLIATAMLFAYASPAKAQSKSRYPYLTLKDMQREDIYQAYGDSLVNITSRLREVLEKQSDKENNPNYDVYVVEFRKVLQNKKILPKDVTIKTFDKNYLYRVDLFTKAIAPTYIAIETGNGLLADDINRDSKFRLIAEIDETFYSLNSFGKKPGKLYVIKWHLGKIKEVDLDGFSRAKNIDVEIKCKGGKCVSTEHVFYKLAGSDGLSIREFIDCRLADCKINPDQKNCCGVYEISPALGAIGEIIAKFDEPK